MRREALSTLLIVACFVSAAVSADQPLHVTVRQLLATPEKFAGKRVDVTGFYRAGTEDSCLLACAHCADDEVRTEKSIWVEHCSGPAYERRRVRIIGTFRYQPNPILGASVSYERRLRGFGCYNIWAREITDITHFESVR